MSMVTQASIAPWAKRRILASALAVGCAFAGGGARGDEAPAGRPPRSGAPNQARERAGGDPTLEEWLDAAETRLKGLLLQATLADLDTEGQLLLARDVAEERRRQLAELAQIRERELRAIAQHFVRVTKEVRGPGQHPEVDAALVGLDRRREAIEQRLEAERRPIADQLAQVEHAIAQLERKVRAREIDALLRSLSSGPLPRADGEHLPDAIAGAGAAPEAAPQERVDPAQARAAFEKLQEVHRELGGPPAAPVAPQTSAAPAAASSPSPGK